MNASYRYNATVAKVIDGDTVVLDVDLGFFVSARYSARLDGINAAEHDTPGGKAAKAHLESVLPVGAKVLVDSKGVDKYGGRFDGVIYLTTGVNLNEQLVLEQWAAPYTGEGAKNVPPWPRTVT